jgi:hypothetical protein
MALIIRIDVDRPYGRYPFTRHVLSRLSSDLYFPKICRFGYLSELQTLLSWLRQEGSRAYVFFRRCTLPSNAVLESLQSGGHEIGLHLENSRSFGTFLEEAQILQRHIGKKVQAVSKHGSGGSKFGLRHYAPYEPEKYIEWARHSSMKLFLGNLEDPSLPAVRAGADLALFPGAFWLEPYWRDTTKFPVEWLLRKARHQDIVLLVHPENVIADPELINAFKTIIRSVESTILQ